MSDAFIFQSALRDLLRVKKLIAVLILVLVPVGIALLARSIVPADKFVAADTYNLLSQTLIFGFLLVILACVFGTSVISQEVEQKTIVYLLTRPVPRWRILLMKFAATFLATTVAAWLASLLLMLGTYGLHSWGQAPIGHDLLILPVVCLAYGGVFLLLATLFNRPLIFGLLYAFGVESWVPLMPGNFKMLSLMSYVHVLAPHAAAAAENADTLPQDSLTPRLAWGVVVGVIVVALAGAAFIFSNREYVPREDL